MDCYSSYTLLAMQKGKASKGRVNPTQVSDHQSHPVDAQNRESENDSFWIAQPSYPLVVQNLQCSAACCDAYLTWMDHLEE